jgi:hypothetical protein
MIAIMQPYFAPFVGYFQLIACVDTFVVYDDVQFTKKGYMTSNRINLDGHEETISVNVREKSAIALVRDKHIALSEFARTVEKLRARLSRRRFFDASLFDRIMTPRTDNLYDYLGSQIAEIAELLSLRTRIVRSSAIADTRALRGQQKIVALCQALGDLDYVNSAGGNTLYTKEGMAAEGVRLRWLTYRAATEAIAAPYSMIQSISDLDLADLRQLARICELG